MTAPTIRDPQTGKVNNVGRRPPRGWVVEDPVAQGLEGDVDWSAWYLTDEDDMGEGGEQFVIAQALWSALHVLARERGWRSFVGRDQFFGWVEAEPLVRVSPDVYLLDREPSRPLPGMWETWRPEHAPPRLAVEIVSDETWRKDYADNPAKYAQLGARELVIFDPWAVTSRRLPERTPLQVFHRAPDGAFLRAHAGPGPARSEALDAWWTVVAEPAPMLRVSRDASGRDLVPTQEEALASALAELVRLRGAPPA